MVSHCPKSHSKLIPKPPAGQEVFRPPSWVGPIFSLLWEFRPLHFRHQTSEGAWSGPHGGAYLWGSEAEHRALRSPRTQAQPWKRLQSWQPADCIGLVRHILFFPQCFLTNSHQLPRSKDQEMLHKNFWLLWKTPKISRWDRSWTTEQPRNVWPYLGMGAPALPTPYPLDATPGHPALSLSLYL